MLKITMVEMKSKKELHTVRTSYSFYKQKVKSPILLQEYLDLIHDFFKFMLEEMYEAREIILPYKLGSIIINGRKRKAKIVDGELTGVAPDWKRTKELWNKCEDCKERKQLVYHLNEHTDYVRYKFFWKKKDVLVHNKTLYYFKPARAVKRKLAQLIKQGKEFYLA